MVLGCIWCPADHAHDVSRQIRELKASHGLATREDYTPPNKPFEVKWTKISPIKAQFYTHLVDLFFDDQDLRFRAILIPDKSKLKHSLFNQTHDDWYYKMMFLLIDRIL
jgi:hypothetical protein